MLKTSSDSLSLFSNFSYFLLPNFSLLCDPQSRLGQDVEEVKRHPFFRGTDWEHIR